MSPGRGAESSRELLPVILATSLPYSRPEVRWIFQGYSLVAAFPHTTSTPVVRRVHICFGHVIPCIPHQPSYEPARRSCLFTLHSDQVCERLARFEVDLNHWWRSLSYVDGLRLRGWHLRRQVCGGAGQLCRELGPADPLRLERAHAATFPALDLDCGFRIGGIAPFPTSSITRLDACSAILPTSGTWPLNDSFVKSARSPSVC